MPIEPFDDLSIENEDTVIRFIHPLHVIFDETLGEYRPTSAAFEMSSEDGCMSVDIEKLLIEAGFDSLKNISLRPAGSRVVRLVVSYIRSEELAVFKDPLLENPYHGQIANLTDHGRIPKSKKRRLSGSSEWITIPD